MSSPVVRPCAPRRVHGFVALLLLALWPLAAGAAEARWRLHHMEVQRPSAAQLGNQCSFQGDGGRNGNIGGSQFQTTCQHTAMKTTAVWSGSMGWSYVTQGFQPPVAGPFNEGLDILVPGHELGFAINAASTSPRATVSGQVLVRTLHPAAGTLTLAATPYTTPQGKVSAMGHGRVPGKPTLLPDGRAPQLRLTFALLGTSASMGIQVHLLYDWVEEGAPPPPPRPPAPPTGAPTTPATPAGLPSLGCFRDDRWSRDLNGFTYNTPSMTTQACVSTCAQRGFRYAATQYSTHCFCDNAYGKLGPATGCNMPCGGNKAEMCGGYSVNSVYATGR